PALVGRAVELGAAYVGLVFYPPSPRYLDPARAREIAAAVAAPAKAVGLFVDATEREIEAVLRYVPLDVLQLHGNETPDRVRQLALWSGLEVMKALRIEEASDLAPLDEHADAADMVLFDAKPPRGPGALPGGNGSAFDWRLLEGVSVAKPWALAGGLSPDNLAGAVGLLRPPIVDVSSGIESRPGVKDMGKMEAFLREARRLSAPEGT
ncbi:MAG TPA: phosphoribosylanthranilate isomerase, partial [Geminicoccaceae bacterium]